MNLGTVVLTIEAPLSPAEQGKAVQAAYDAGKVELGQKLNIEAGIARGGSAVSGGAMKADR